MSLIVTLKMCLKMSSPAGGTQEQVFLSMASLKVWMNLQEAIIKIYSQKPRWLPNRLHIAS